MKTFSITVALLSSLFVVSCKKDCDCPEKTAKTETATTQTTHDESMFNKDAATTGSAATTRSESTTKKPRRATSKSQNYLSQPAPDGTDAENHDGDYYTRNDTTRMPTGTPIK